MSRAPSWSSINNAISRKNMHKMIDDIMQTPKYQEARRIDNEQATLRALCRFCFMACEYLELKHGYKANGLQSFLKFAKLRVVEIGNDEDAFESDSKYYKENYNLDVMGFLGLEMVKGE